MFDGVDGGSMERSGATVAWTAASVLIRLNGAMDGQGVCLLRDGFAALAENAANDVVVDLRAVTYLDGAGIGAIAFLFRGLAKRGLRLRIAGAHGQPLRTLRELGLNRLVDAGHPSGTGKARRWPWMAEARA